MSALQSLKERFAYTIIGKTERRKFVCSGEIITKVAKGQHPQKEGQETWVRGTQCMLLDLACSQLS